MSIDEKISKIHKAKIAGKIIYGTALIVIIALLFIRIDFVCKMQTDSLNQTMELRQEIDEIKKQLTVIEEKEPVVFESLGEYKITAYCACEKCCGIYADGYTATGTKATEGRTIAVDPKVIPYGSQVLINGQIYTAEDCGGSIKGNRIDMYYDSHQEALQHGVQYAEVHLI